LAAPAGGHALALHFFDLVRQRAEQSTVEGADWRRIGHSNADVFEPGEQR